MSGARVVVEEVSRVHPGPIVAVADVSLTLEPEEFVALTGPSGSGKTSLLALIGGLDAPTSGRIEVDGLELGPRTELSRYHRETVGFVFQHHHLLAHLTAVTNVELALLGAGVARRERRERAMALLDEVGLTHRADSTSSHLSGGERQRVALARALANAPALLLADEPTGSLDSDASQRVLGLMERARERRGMTMLVVTYDPYVAGRADRTLHLRDGRLVAEDRPVLRARE
ncbi:MAG: transporter ATP-binding protein [Solirubrobacterales bacterium]|nr:transporter ATP-binding protein [Solirubrobacterales bacterium]